MAEQLSLFGEDEFADIDEFDENGVKAKVQSGEIWQLGEHRLMCGDATNPEDVKKLVGENKIDLLLTDPPYNVNYNGKTKNKLTIANDHFKDKQGFIDFLTDAFSNIYPHLKDGGAFYVWYASSSVVEFSLSLSLLMN